MSVTIPRKILVAIDGSESSLKAVAYAAQLAKLASSKLLILNVMLLPEFASTETVEKVRKDLMTKAGEILDHAKSVANIAKVDLETKTAETDHSVVETIVEQSEIEKADLIVVGSRGVTMGRLMLGSVAAGTVNLARCPVLVAR